MKKNILIGITIILSFILQSSVFQHVSFGGIVPNLLIVITAAYGFMFGHKSGMIVGFFSGLLVDIFLGDVLCFYALIYMYIGYCNGYFETIFYKEDIKLPLALITGSDLIYNLVTYVLLFLLRSRFHFSYYFLHIIAPEIVYTIVVTIVYYPFILWLSKFMTSSNKRRNKSVV